MALIDSIILSWGWRRRLIALIAGAVGALAMAPFDFFPAMFVPMTVAVWLIDGSVHASRGAGSREASLLWSALEAAQDGWWLGLGYFVGGLWWIGAAFLVEADQFAWALPLAVLGLPAVLALFTALGFALARLLWSGGPGRVAALALGLGLGEWLRGHVATGFPWNEVGMALGGNIVLGQAGSLTGLYGLNIVAVLIFAAPAGLFDGASPRRSVRRLAGAPALGAVLLAAVTLFGIVHLWMATSEMVPGVRLRIMQPNLTQDAKFRSDNRDEILRHYMGVSDRATSPETSGVSDATHLVWPESAFPFILSRDAASLARLGSFLGRNTLLITGAARIEERPRSERLPGESSVTYFNAIQIVSNNGEILGTYDKQHLVPFGEYLPFSGLLETFGIRHFVHIPGGFEAARQRALLDVPGLPPAAALICYEAIFPGEAVPVDAQDRRPGLLLNVTNDGWFGNTAGPHQHFSQARLRAIEEGLPLVRSANTGISAITDGYGRIQKSLPLSVEGVVDGPLPKALPATFFALHPATGTLILLLFCLFAAVTWRRTKN